MDNSEQVDLIIKYESGEATAEEELNLFSHLIKTGLCWKLQGHYGRIAEALISNNIISKDGVILI